MAKTAQRLNALASAAGDAQRALETHIAHVDGEWTDDARRSFETEHLAAIRGDARALRTTLADVAAEFAKAVRSIERT